MDTEEMAISDRDREIQTMGETDTERLMWDRLSD